MPLKPKPRGAHTPGWHENWVKTKAEHAELPPYVRPQGRETDNKVPK
jgi:hypothetical protein